MFQRSWLGRGLPVRLGLKRAGKDTPCELTAKSRTVALRQWIRRNSAKSPVKAVKACRRKKEVSRRIRNWQQRPDAKVVKQFRRKDAAFHRIGNSRRKPAGRAVLRGDLRSATAKRITNIMTRPTSTAMRPTRISRKTPSRAVFLPITNWGTRRTELADHGT